ncbi:helix-turn-helix transcriptional regulator [Acetobacteraceae bacterium H6797]|nr:helix-turn-helix transcriptional regulator [Acetobacteraceae bacterium H6797]
MADDTELDIEAACALRNMTLVRPVLDRIADKWTILILTVLCPRPARFNEIKRRVGCITHKALADALKRLERNGLVTRTVLPTSPIGVEYAITPLGHSLRGPFEALCDWAVANGQSFLESPPSQIAKAEEAQPATAA